MPRVLSGLGLPLSSCAPVFYQCCWRHLLALPSAIPRPQHLGHPKATQRVGKATQGRGKAAQRRRESNTSALQQTPQWRLADVGKRIYAPRHQRRPMADCDPMPNPLEAVQAPKTGGCRVSACGLPSAIVGVRLPVAESGEKFRRTTKFELDRDLNCDVCI